MSTNNFELQNFADDNTITSSSGTLSKLIKDLQSEANKATSIIINKKDKTILLK